MTVEQFQQKVLKVNWYDKYFYYLFFFAATLSGFLYLYDVVTNQAKYGNHGTRYLGYFSFLFSTALGISGFYFIPNRYKIITIDSSLSIDKKREIVSKVLEEFGNPICTTDNDFFYFTYTKNLWASDYKIYLGFDLTNFYASVQGVTRAYQGGGIIDFGATEKVRKRLSTCLKNLVEGQ